jgi:hypothetical protein
MKMVVNRHLKERMSPIRKQNRRRNLKTLNAIIVARKGTLLETVLTMKMNLQQRVKI